MLGSSYFDNTIDMAFSASKHVHISCMYAVHDTVYIYIVPYIYHVLAVILCTLTAYCYQKLNRNNSGALVRLISRFVHYLLYVCVCQAGRANSPTNGIIAAVTIEVALYEVLNAK